MVRLLSTFILTAVFTIVFYQNCGKPVPDKLSDEKDYQMIEESVGVLGSVMNDVEQTVSTSDHSVVNSCKLADLRSNCVLSGGYYSHKISYNGCLTDEGRVSLTGSWNNLYIKGESSADDCNYARSKQMKEETQITKSASNIRRQHLDGTYVTISTDPHKTYSGIQIQTPGITVDHAITSDFKIKMDGVRAQRYTTSGSLIYDYTLRFNDENKIKSEGSRDSNSRIISGENRLIVFNNAKKYQGVLTFTDVKWGDSSCCFPTSGSIKMVRTGSKTGEVNLDFTDTCGIANFKYKSNNTDTTDRVALEACF